MTDILFFAQLREQLGCEQVQVELKEATAVADLIGILVTQYPQWQRYLTNNKLLVAVNQTMVDKNHTIHPNDEVALFPPVTGG
ncbi:molybdopterin converting factor subunit 1 [Psychrosphaera sp. B3R10]|uniref:Molybdopterin synthase sulfur carrier subunit n=1 Tax=Psychrosphaera algicola TaxID=3023714 RepID=A0ABT5FCC2_9GAMM|nr:MULTISPECIES: molybdopterin converting factor subunit 1 [unclassified Psychrosphaera]MBU2883494.1 molybdopterin converting factor subunit 1 [Psychrosphaera sp. I2R16]MBU2989673.1 molybdopterin converting factor subunit 1 [Psychrosphaera sp. B3R10]MDC2888493.1 molybdopterin converting factor subunit 1 [Psychrosphaera sp. G1-22]MDO6719886.1 molybdopterin converting factor subunit 1 [Psychrosphaera sp. 1_MG-2023]